MVGEDAVVGKAQRFKGFGAAGFDAGCDLGGGYAQAEAGEVDMVEA